MIFADKLIALRKKAGWTQEELGEKMEVSRQSIAKWEGAQSIPELNKLLKLSQLFGVSLDYLLKDEIEETAPQQEGEEPPYRMVTLETAQTYMQLRQQVAPSIALGTLLCVLSPVGLILFSLLSLYPQWGISQNAAAGLGMCLLLVMVAVAVFLFLRVGNKSSEYGYLDKEPIETQYGVEGLVKERRNTYKARYDTCNTVGTMLCICSVLPLFLTMAFNRTDVNMALSVCLLFVLVAIGVYLFVRAGVVWASFSRLLQIDEYSKKNKQAMGTPMGAVSGSYWMIVTAIYLTVSFAMDSWSYSWIIWALAGVLYPLFMSLLRSRLNKRGDK